MNQQCVLAARRANYILGCSKHNTGSWKKDLILLLYLVLVQPYFKYGVQFWGSRYKKHVKILDSIQRRAIQLVMGLKGVYFEKRLRTLGLSSLKKKRPGGNLAFPCRIHEEGKPR